MTIPAQQPILNFKNNR